MHPLTWWTTSPPGFFGWPPRWPLCRSWPHPFLDSCTAVSSHISPLDVMSVKERQTRSELKALLRFTSSQRALRGEKMASVTYLKWSDYFHTNTNTLLLSYTLTAPVSLYWLKLSSVLLRYRPCASNLDGNQVCIALQRESSPLLYSLY